MSGREKQGRINEILEQEEGIAMASQVLVNISRDEHERARLPSEYKYIVDTQSKVVQAERAGLTLAANMRHIFKMLILRRKEVILLGKHRCR